MWKVLQKIGFFVVTLAITAAIFWLVFMDKQSKQDVLEHSLGLLGEKLMAMVPDTTDNKPVQEWYDDFFEKAKKKELPPEKIEQVAATILNLTNIDTTVTPKEATAILKLSLAEPIKIDRFVLDTFKISEKKDKTQQVVVVPPELPKPPKTIQSEQWISLGQRIKSAYEFNTEMQKALQQQHKKYRDQHLWMSYRVEDGLRIAIDSNLKPELNREKFKKLQQELKELEKKQVVIWQKNFREEMQREVEQRKQELESLKKLRELERLHALQDLEALESLEALKSLEVLQHLPIVNADSIRIIVEKSLKEAGIYNQDRK